MQRRRRENSEVVDSVDRLSDKLTVISAVLVHAGPAISAGSVHANTPRLKAHRVAKSACLHLLHRSATELVLKSSLAR